MYFYKIGLPFLKIVKNFKNYRGGSPYGFIGIMIDYYIIGTIICTICHRTCTVCLFISIYAHTHTHTHTRNLKFNFN